MHSNIKTLKICLCFLCLLHFRAVGMPQDSGAAFFMEPEIWKDVNGHEGRYQVSNLGRIKKLKCFFNREEKILKNQLGHHGYQFFGFRNNGAREFFLIHRIVATHFLERDVRKTHVNHKDGNKQNNNVNNLEWVTPRENTLHAYANGLIKGKRLKKLV